jgi:hypothetical protein
MGDGIKNIKEVISSVLGSNFPSNPHFSKSQSQMKPSEVPTAIRDNTSAYEATVMSFLWLRVVRPCFIYNKPACRSEYRPSFFIKVKFVMNI